jgi:hypothetical protein
MIMLAASDAHVEVTYKKALKTSPQTSYAKCELVVHVAPHV